MELADTLKPVKSKSAMEDIVSTQILGFNRYQMDQLNSLKVIGMTEEEALNEVMGLVSHFQEKSMRSTE